MTVPKNAGLTDAQAGVVLPGFEARQIWIYGDQIQVPSLPDIEIQSEGQTVLITVGEGIQLAAPVRVTVVEAPGDVKLTGHSIQIRVLSGANAHFILDTYSFGSELIRCDRGIDISLAADSRCELHLIQRLGDGTDYSRHIRIHQAARSGSEVVLVSQGGAVQSHQTTVALAGDDAVSQFYSLSIANGKTRIYDHIHLSHQAPHTQSEQLIKAILYDHSRTEFEGMVAIQPEAQASEAHQVNRNLVLSPMAEAQTMPQLEILANDVTATHGATVGQLDDDQLFYLRSRGFSEALAKHLIVDGFCGEILGKVALDCRRLVF